MATFTRTLDLISRASKQASMTHDPFRRPPESLPARPIQITNHWRGRARANTLRDSATSRTAWLAKRSRRRSMDTRALHTSLYEKTRRPTVSPVRAVPGRRMLAAVEGSLVARYLPTAPCSAECKCCSTKKPTSRFFWLPLLGCLSRSICRARSSAHNPRSLSKLRYRDVRSEGFVSSAVQAVENCGVDIRTRYPSSHATDKRRTLYSLACSLFLPSRHLPGVAPASSFC